MTRLSPAQRHYHRVLAAKCAATNDHGAVMTGDAYELMQIKLAEDRRRLKSIHSIERKIDVKQQILPDYQDWIVGVLNDGKGAQDDVLTTVLVWHIDAGNFGIALQIADYVVKHDLKLPDQYGRNVATMLMDEVAGAYLAGKFDDVDAAITTLEHIERLVAPHDAPDQARAKLHKALAYAALAIIDRAGEDDIAPTLLPLAKTAEQHLQRALALFTGIGVKKDIERLERRIKKANRA